MIYSSSWEAGCTLACTAFCSGGGAGFSDASPPIILVPLAPGCLAGSGSPCYCLWPLLWLPLLSCESTFPS